MNKTSVTQRLRNRSKEMNVNYNTVLSQFFFDEFLKLLSYSPFRGNFMLKGGILLTYSLGVQNRATQDMDFLIKGIQMDEFEIKNILLEIIGTSTREGIWFEIIGKGEEIRSVDEYGGLRFNVIGHLSNIRLPFSIDIATGDPVYPSAKEAKYRTILGEEIMLKQYPLESVLSEKLQTIIMRAESNGRSKDFYDIYVILKDKEQDISFDSLKIAVLRTFEYRGTPVKKEEAKEIINKISSNALFLGRWQRYVRKNPYTNNLDFYHVMKRIEELIDRVM